MKPAARTAHNELIDELNAMWRDSSSFYSPDDVRILVLHKKADDTKRNAAIDGWALTGIIHALTGDREQSEYAFRNSLRIGGNNEFVIGNWLAARGGLGAFSSAQELFEEWGDPHIGILSTLLREGLNCGAVFQAAQFMETAVEKLHMDVDAGLRQHAAALCAAFREQGVTDRTLGAHLDAAGDVLYRNRLATRRVSTLTDFDSGTVLYQVSVGSGNDIFALNLELAKEQIKRSLKPTPNLDVVITE